VTSNSLKKIRGIHATPKYGSGHQTKPGVFACEAGGRRFKSGRARQTHFLWSSLQLPSGPSRTRAIPCAPQRGE